MCGIVGLFVGCPVVASCPKKAFLQGRDVGSEHAYRSPFGNWFERAAVRRTPRHVLQPDEGPYMFSPDLVPVAQHPLVRALPPREFEALLVQHAYRYLDFTAKLEHLVVNRTVAGIAHGTTGVEVPDEMRFDAYKIYCDEGYHALFSADLVRQIEARTGIPPALPDPPYFLQRLAQIRESVGPDMAPLAELLFVVCSETLISATLAEAPRDPGVPAAVRDAIRTHALDEGRHHAYFASFLRYLWAQLDPKLRGFAARLLPRLVMTFLWPDLGGLRPQLESYSLTRDEVEQVLAEVYAPHVVASHARAVSRQTIAHFTAVGAFDDAAVRDELASYGLLDDAPGSSLDPTPEALDGTAGGALDPTSEALDGAAAAEGTRA